MKSSKMDFSVIRRRKKSPKKSALPPPPLPTPPEPPKAPPPPPPQRGPFSPYMEDLGRLERLKSVEYANYYRMNFDGYPNQQFGSYHHYPVGQRGVDYNQNQHHPMLTGAPPRMALPPPSYGHGPPPRLGPSDYGPPRMALPQPEYHHGQPDYQYGPPPNYGPPPPNVQYYGPPPNHYGGYFSDENPNGCIIM